MSNAGYCQAGAIEETSHEQRAAQFATNFFGGEPTVDVLPSLGKIKEKPPL